MYVRYSRYVEWDSRKAKTNARKHGVAFEDAAKVLFDDDALTVQDPHDSERRFATLGLDAKARLIVLVYTWRHDRVRIISARKATRRERRSYER